MDKQQLTMGDGYTYAQAHALIGCAHQLYVSMLVDRDELTVLGKVAKAKKDGTASKVEVVLLTKESVERYARLYARRNNTEARWYKAKLLPEEYEAVKKIAPAADWQDLTERKEEQDLRKVERRLAELNGK